MYEYTYIYISVCACACVFLYQSSISVCRGPITARIELPLLISRRSCIPPHPCAIAVAEDSAGRGGGAGGGGGGADRPCRIVRCG